MAKTVVHDTLTVTREPEAVWAALTDWANAGAWLSSRIEDVDAPAVTTDGATVSFHMDGGAVIPFEVQDCDAPTTLSLAAETGGVHVRYRYHLARTEAGHTAVSLQADLGFNWFMRLFGGFLKAVLREMDQGQLERLKAHVEGK